MSLLRSDQTQVVADWPAHANAAVTSNGALVSGKPALWRRGLAELIDRTVPLPLLALIFPKWVVVVLLYHLLCEAAPERRSVGKWVCRLRVVAVESGVRAALWQAVARRVGSALSQTAWCSWQWWPWAVGYEIAALICVLLSPAGQRPEDWVAGTRVVTERVFRQLRLHQSATAKSQDG
ncbi:MAG: RDD family protein [Acidobacteria bacterium]|nr:RDD family protein [Acidobacteriota bacterium]MBI3424088.1 RDD family protein [Acidobacteriota bacterium]